MSVSSLTLRHFRGFKTLDITDLRRINILTGLNGSGKTSVLEGVFLLCGGANAGLAVAITNFRGESSFNPLVDFQFRSLFFSMTPESPISLSCVWSSPEERRSCTRDLVIEQISSPDFSSTASRQRQTISGLSFFFSGPSGQARSKLSWDIEQQSSIRPISNRPPRLHVEGDRNSDVIQGFFVSPYFRDIMEQNHKQLNEAIKDRKIDDIVRYLRLLEPRLKGISPLTEGPIPTVYVDLGQESLLPLSSAGSGISNFLHMVLPISLTDRGVVIIDEIEDGIHHSKLEELSRFIIRSSKDKDIQFFISTHSREFIDTFRAACRLEGFQDLSLLRCSQKNGENYVTRYDYSEFEAAEELQAEMR